MEIELDKVLECLDNEEVRLRVILRALDSLNYHTHPSKQLWSNDSDIQKLIDKYTHKNKGESNG
jgi:proteasome lid subunit RPN8/RPN11